MGKVRQVSDLKYRLLEMEIKPGYYFISLKLILIIKDLEYSFFVLFRARKGGELEDRYADHRLKAI